MDLERARFNMIEQQIRPWNVLDQEVLDLLRRVRREEFVPEAYRSLAFSDLEIPIKVAGKNSGQFMLSPKLEAKLLQELAPHKMESVLEIGAGTGYMAALLAHRAREVLSLDIDPTLVQLAQANLRSAGVINARVECANGAKFNSGTYDAILLSGSVAQVPSSLLELLKESGRLIAVVGNAPSLSVQKIVRHPGNRFTSSKLIDAGAPALHDFPAPEKFSF